MEFGEFIRHAAKHAEGKSLNEFKSQKEALKALQKYMSHESGLKVGDEVERNVYGLAISKYPDKDDNQTAIITHIFEEPQLEDGTFYDAILTVALGENVFRAYPVNTRWFSKVTERKNVVSWRRKKESD